MGRSSAFEAGDTIRSTSGQPSECLRTVDYVGPQMVVFTVHRPAGDMQHSSYLKQFLADYELVPEVFESGKTYVLSANGVQVECLYADDTVALIVNKVGAKYLRSQNSRTDYEEV